MLLTAGCSEDTQGPSAGTDVFTDEVAQAGDAVVDAAEPSSDTPGSHAADTLDPEVGLPDDDVVLPVDVVVPTDAEDTAGRSTPGTPASRAM